MQDDPRHHEIRRLVTPVGEPEAAALHRGRRWRRAATTSSTTPWNGAPVTSSSTSPPSCPLQAIASLLGVPQDDRHFLLDWADATLDYDDHDPGRDLGATAGGRRRPCSTYCDPAARPRSGPARPTTSCRSSPPPSCPPAAAAGGPLTELEQQMFFHLLVAAGSETTRNSITAGLLALHGPTARSGRRCATTDRCCPSAVEEMLRWASSTIYNRRTATARSSATARRSAPATRSCSGGRRRTSTSGRSPTRSRVRHRPRHPTRT